MNTPALPTGLVWFRRDLRLDDHAPLARALAQCGQVYTVFVFDREILDRLPRRRDRRVAFIHGSVQALDEALRAHGGGLIVLHDQARDAIPALAAQLGVKKVFAGRDYEPAAVARDAVVEARLAALGCGWETVKDQVVFETDEVLTRTRQPFSVFTPYRNAWLARLENEGALKGPLARCNAPEAVSGRLAVPTGETAPPTSTRRGQDAPRLGVPSLEEMGFEPLTLEASPLATGEAGAQAGLADFLERIGQYKTARDYPGIKGPSYLSVHLRFGTISVRTLARAAWGCIQSEPDAAEGARTWLSELIWRDFYHQILHHHPQVEQAAFKPEYNAIEWESGAQAEALFQAWCEGRTGYPLVDAAMRQLLQTGYMHNRLRMVSASFLCKDLGIDWRRGEAFFAEHLNDFDLAANNGGWQWASSSGCDAQPYFRIFNPVTQSEKFDPQGRFIRRYVPELARLPDAALHAPWLLPPATQSALGCVMGRDYPAPVVDHAQARARTLARYAVAKRSGEVTDA